jgi:hypothetical protein
MNQDEIATLESTVIELSECRDKSKPAFEIAFVGISDTYIIEFYDLKTLVYDFDPSYVAIGCSNITEDLLEEELDFDVIDDYINLSDHEMYRVHALIEQSIEANIEDAISRKDQCYFYNGTKSDYARDVVRRTICEDSLPSIISNNINYDGVFSESYNTRWLYEQYKR